MNSEFLAKRSWQIAALFCFVGVIYTQYAFNNWWASNSYSLPVSYNEFIEPQPLTGQAAQVASFGQKDFLADYYWLSLIQYYGGGDPGGKYRKLADLYNTITDLSPKNVDVYQSGLLILPSEGYVDQAIALGEKGQKNVPEAWQMPYYEGLVYHIYKKDYVSAAKEFTLASERPGAPANAAYFAALYYKEADQRQVSLQLFQNVYETTTDSYLKDRAAKYVTHLQIVFGLEDQVNQFKVKYGRYPFSLQELVDRKMIDSVPTSPLGFPFSYDSTTGQISEGK